MAVEQIFFTWAKRGLSGHGMLQPVRTSAGFAGLSEQDRQLALTLCQYDAGTAAKIDYPPSLGWIDRGSMRFAFSRVFLHDPSLQAGRPGNFAAHIAIGPAVSLPVSDLLGRFLSDGCWWQGPRSSDDLALPESLEWPQPPRCRRPRTGAATAAAILSSLFESACPIRSDADPHALLAGLVHIVDLLPQALDGFSVSTFEGPRMAGWFDLTGSHPVSRTLMSPEAEYLLQHRDEAEFLHPLHPKDDPRRAEDLAEIRAWARVSRDMAAGTVQPETIARILRLPHLVPQALDHWPALDEALSAAVAGRNPVVRSALLVEGSRIRADTLDRIGHSAGRLVSPTYAEQVSTDLAGMPADFHAGYAHAVAGRTDMLPRIRRWSLDTIERLFDAALDPTTCPPKTRETFEARLIEVGGPASLTLPALSSQCRARLFAAVCRRWTRPWGLSSSDLAWVLADIGPLDGESLSLFFGSAPREELGTRTSALRQVSHRWNRPMRLSSAAVTALLEGAASSHLPDLLSVLDLSVITAPAPRRSLERVVLTVLERYEHEPVLVLTNRFWSALQSNSTTAPYALAHAGDRQDHRMFLPTNSDRIRDFLAFEAYVLNADARNLYESLEKRELGWLAVTTLRATLRGAHPQWVMDMLSVIYAHAKLWRPSWFGRAGAPSDYVTASIMELTYQAAQTCRGEFARFSSTQSPDTRRLLKEWGIL